MATITFRAVLSSGSAVRESVHYQMDDMGKTEEVSRIPAWQDTPGATHYLGFVDHPTEGPTEAQREVIAKTYLTPAKDGTGPLPAFPNAAVCAWAFAGLGGPDEVSRRYGNGRKIYVA